MPHSILQEDDSTITSETVPSILNTLKNQVRNKQVDRDEEIDRLETEIRLLRRQLPRLRNAKGKDITTEFMLLGEEYDKKRYEVEYLQAELEKCRKYFAETSKKHCNTVKEYDQRLQSIRQEFENSVIQDGSGRAAIEQAEQIVAAEYQSRINTLTAELETLQAVNRSAEDYERQIAALNAELEALRAENKQYADEKLDLAEQREIDEENQKRYDEMEAYYMAELKKRDEIIVDLEKFVPAGLSGKNVSAKEFLTERLKADLGLLEPEWQSNDILRIEIEKIMNGIDDGPDTVSQLHERLENERSRIRVDSNSTSSSDGAPNYTTRDVTEAFNCVSAFKKLLQPLIFHLKKLPHYLEGINGISENAEFHELLRQITNITFDLDATVNDVTGALAGIEEFERTLNRTPSPNIFGGPPPTTAAAKETMESLLNEVKALRTKLAAEILQKNEAQEKLQPAKNDVERLTIRVQELADEKITLQNELRDLEEDFNDMKEKYENARQGNDVEQLSEALIEAKKSIKAKSNALAEATRQLEIAKQEIQEVSEAYNHLKAINDAMQKDLDERIDEVELLDAECQRLKTDLKNANLGSSHLIAKNHVEADHQKLKRNFDSLKKDNADLLDQNKSLQDRFSKLEDKLNSYKNYLRAIFEKISKNNPQIIECPPFFTARVHQYLMDRLDSSGPEVVSNFDYAYNKLQKIKLSEENGDTSENSIASNPPVASSVAKTLAEISQKLLLLRDYANELVHNIKKVKKQEHKLNIDWYLEKIRQIRNELHLSSKYLEAKKEKIEDGASLPDVIGELEKIHSVLGDVKVAARVLRPEEIVAKGRSYR